MKVWDKGWVRFRIHVVSALFAVGMAVVIFRAFQLMVIEGGRLGALAKEDYTGRIKLPPMRGAIYDRKGRELALSVQVWSIYAHPNKIYERKPVADKLASILDERPAEIMTLLNPKAKFAWIKRRVPAGVADAVRSCGLEGVVVVPEPGRYYPGKELAAHVIGFVGRENQALEGIEKRYDEMIRGDQGTLLQIRDAHARTISVMGPDRLEQGTHEVVLTIDSDLQYKAQQALKEAVIKRNAAAGHCLVVNPDTGEILAMAVMPEFNPNSFDAYSPEDRRNRSVTDSFEPGSVFKAFLLAAALEEGAVTPDTLFDCENGSYSIGGSNIRDVHKHGVLTAAEVVAKSSNIGAIKMGMRLGYEKLVRYLKRFGFGEKTSSDFIGEREGFVRDASRAKLIDQATVFFGQGITVTSLQLAMAFSALANGGKLMKPVIVKKITNEHGEAIEENQPHVVRRVITSRTSDVVTRILEGVVSKEGTAPMAAIEGYRVAGKTGTAQKVDPLTRRYSDRKFVAVFGGYVFNEKSRLVIIVVVDEPRGVSYGGVVAGPVFKEIGKWSANSLGMDPIPAVAGPSVPRPHAIEEAPDPKKLLVLEVADEIRSGTIPDFTGLSMRESLDRAYALGLKTVLKGSGFASAQEPEPGTDLRDAEVVTLSFNPTAQEVPGSHRPRKR